MYALIVRRLIVLPIMLLLASLVVFMVPYLSDVDPAMAILRARVSERELTPETVDRFKAEYGLDRPLMVQYLGWLGRLVRGDLGVSYVSRVPVAEILMQGLRITVVLTSISVGVAFIIAIPLGVLAATRPGGWLDTVIATVSQTGVAIPEYWLAPILILVFALWLGWLPSAGWRGPLFVIMPVMTLALRPIAYFTRLTRATMIDVLSMQFIRAARARGLTKFQAIWRHALRNALIPVITLATLWLAALLGGSVIVEVIFAVPGLGRILYDAVVANDLPLIQAGLVLIVSLAVIINTLTDLTYIILNPAIRLEGVQQ